MAKLPKNLNELFEKKDSFLDRQRDIFEKDVTGLQKKLFNKLVEEVVSQLDVKNGIIQNTKNNLRLINELEIIYKEFANVSQRPVVEKFASGFAKVDRMNMAYFKVIALNEVGKKRFDAVVKKTESFMHSRIGIKDGALIKGGYLESFMNDRTLLNEIRQVTMRAVTGQMEGKSFTKQLSDIVVGNEERAGGFEKHYRTYAYDSLQEYDRAYGKQMAVEFKLNYAVYQGGLIKDSREFCKEHNDKVYSRDEIAQFGKWKDPETGEVPSYISKFPGYDPEVHCGGFNCRHSLTWIGDQTAFRLRPDLLNK